jgi:hypothetical protein
MSNAEYWSVASAAGGNGDTVISRGQSAKEMAANKEAAADGPPLAAL